jgi:uncharacterized lipoprotein NlpE involved in copper resistance
MTISTSRALALSALLLLGCAASPQRPPAATPFAPPQTFSGELPCADCTAQRLALTLFPDGSFRERRTYVDAEPGVDRDVHELGRWKQQGDVVVLRGARGDGAQFRRAADGGLRLLDRSGAEIRSSANYTLAPRAELDPIAGPLPLRGEYSYYADAASVRECATGLRYPVPLEGDHLALERAYLALPHEPGAPVLAHFWGRFELREPEPGAAPREHLVVERFERLAPGERCETGPSAP